MPDYYTGSAAGDEELRQDAYEAAAEQAQGRIAANKDSAMIGGSGYDRIEADHYNTPHENLNCLLQHVNIHEKVWECAVGKGNLAEQLHDFGHTVWSSDIIDYGFDERFTLSNFLEQTALPDPSIKAIVTNPPYFEDMPEQFIRHALRLMKPVNGQVAMFLRNEYDCSKGRMDLFGMAPFHKKIIVTKRPRWVEGSKGSPRHNYAWFVWDWRHKAGPAAITYSHPDFAPKPGEPKTGRLVLN